MLRGILLIIFGWVGGVYLVQAALDYLSTLVAYFIYNNNHFGFFWSNFHYILDRLAFLLGDHGMMITSTGIIVTLFLFFMECNKREKMGKSLL